MPEIFHLAADLGASSGRVLRGQVIDGALAVAEVHRFATTRLFLPDGLHWDLGVSYTGIVEGVRTATRGGTDAASLGIDSWGCDYGLVDGRGELLGLPFHHRDARYAGGVERVHRLLGASRLYELTGLQHLAFNTVFQLADDLAAGRLGRAERMLMVPDLLTFWLTGVACGEPTNASTTGLFDPWTGTWADPVVDAIGVPRSLLPELVAAGTEVGDLRPEFADAEQLDSVRVVRVGSHDTASAVVAVPASGDDWAYIVSGTWSLVGIEAERPIVTEAGRMANFSNERGVDGRVRYLRNVMGLWLLQESIRWWTLGGEPVDLEGLLTAAAALPRGAVIDPDDSSLLPPGDMPARLARLCEASGQRPPQTPAAITRCILDSLATAYARTLDRVEALAGRAVRTVHVVGGGSQNALLCQLTADASGRTVVAGPVEATAIGNLLVQARATGAASGTLDSLRAVARLSSDLRHYNPRVAP